jgi:hypothetical protein
MRLASIFGVWNMRELPIIFSPAMVRGIRSGRKTATRRRAWEAAVLATGLRARQVQHLERIGHRVDRGAAGVALLHAAPSLWQRARPGDLLWLREPWQIAAEFDAVKLRDMPLHDPARLALHFLSDGPPPSPRGKGRRGFHLPKPLSRITLRLTGQRVEPLHAMTEEDALAEGVVRGRGGFFVEDCEAFRGGVVAPSAVEAFRMLWEALHGVGSWDEAPEVVVLSFEVLPVNIERLAAQPALAVQPRMMEALAHV